MEGKIQRKFAEKTPLSPGGDISSAKVCTGIISVKPTQKNSMNHCHRCTRLVFATEYSGVGKPEIAKSLLESKFLTLAVLGGCVHTPLLLASRSSLLL